jgi:membrane-associated phospholipid phosphatase
VVNQPMKLAGERRRPDLAAFSRIYTGVHYPDIIIMGAVVGGLVGRVTSTVVRRAMPALPRSG